MLIFHAFLLSGDFFKINFFENSFRNTIKEYHYLHDFALMILDKLLADNTLLADFS